MEFKESKIGFRITKDEKECWEFYSISLGYKSLSGFIRDSINGLIEEKRKPKKIVIIE